MGRVKTDWISDEERGWSDPRTSVCQACVGKDRFLRSVIRNNISQKICSYCKSKRRKAAPTSSIMDSVLRGVKYSFNDEANAGCPYDSDFPIDYLLSEDVLNRVLDSEGLDWPEQLVVDVARAFLNNGWVDAPDGDWMGSYLHERLYWSWNSFSDAVKHRSRFHFHISNRGACRWGNDLIRVHEMLPFIGSLIRKHRMVKTISTDLKLHRVRPGKHPKNEAELGPPPRKMVGAGRMNPAGIPYFYLAFDKRTALAETRVKPNDYFTIGTWSSNRELHVIDLSKLPDRPSVFSGKHGAYELINFLHKFVEEISKPIEHDGREHIEYLPTQVVSEYFSQVFKWGARKRVDGLIYSSSVIDVGRNLVVFPSIDSDVNNFNFMKIVDAGHECVS